ncbi:hypothetical protein HNP69_003013 [Chryseobacterium koreense]|nr:hypothetical protein [Chryseobacterium koreense]
MIYRALLIFLQILMIGQEYVYLVVQQAHCIAKSGVEVIRSLFCLLILVLFKYYGKCNLAPPSAILGSLPATLKDDTTNNKT